jgi:hypothetical protein
MKTLLLGLLVGALCLSPVMAQNTGADKKSGQTRQGQAGTSGSTDSTQSTDRGSSTRGRSNTAGSTDSANSPADNTGGAKKSKKKHKKGQETQDQSGAATTR